MESKENYYLNDFIEDIPKFVSHWGFFIIIITCIFILIGTIFIQYPEKIVSRLIITSSNPTIYLNTLVSGKIKNIYHENNTYVDSGSVLIVLESNENYDEINDLKKLLKDFNFFFINKNLKFDHLFEKNFKNIGIFNNEYYNLKKNYEEYFFLISNNFNKEKKNNNEIKIKYYESINKDISKQLLLLEEELVIENKKLDDNKYLFEKNIYSKDLVNSQKQTVIQKEVAIINLKKESQNNKVLIEEYKKNTIELDEFFINKQKDLIIGMKSSYDKLISELIKWEKNYLIISPISGNLNFLLPLKPNFYITEYKNVLAVIPSFSKIEAFAYSPISGSGKINVGQKAILKIDNYPDTEYGTILGNVETISEVPFENQYLLKINLPNGLLTSNKKTLEFKNEMTGAAEIITDDVSLFTRIFNNIRKIFTK